MKQDGGGGVCSGQRTASRCCTTQKPIMSAQRLLQSLLVPYNGGKSTAGGSRYHTHHNMGVTKLVANRLTLVPPEAPPPLQLPERGRSHGVCEAVLGTPTQRCLGAVCTGPICTHPAGVGDCLCWQAASAWLRPR
jgi:hypothetical protein